MPRDDGERGRDSAVRDGDARVGGHGNRRRDARHDLKRDAVFLKQHALFAAAPKDEGIAAFQAHDGLPFLRLQDDEPADILLLHRVMRGCLADVDALGVLRRKAEDAVIGEAVVDDDVRRAQAVHRFHRDETPVAWTCSDEVYHKNRSLLSFCGSRCAKRPLYIAVHLYPHASTASFNGVPKAVRFHAEWKARHRPKAGRRDRVRAPPPSLPRPPSQRGRDVRRRATR